MLINYLILPYLRSQLLLKLCAEVFHHFVYLLVSEGLVGVLERERNRVTLFALAEFVVDIDVENVDLFKVLFLSLLGDALDVLKLHLLVEQQGEITLHFRVLGNLFVLDFLGHKTQNIVPIELREINFLVDVELFENLTVDNFDRTGYKKNQLTNGSKVTAGDPAYKIVTDENWSVAIHVATPEEAQALVDQGYIQVRFLENQLVSWASVSSKTDEDGNCFVNLKFSNSMSSFITDRYVDVELISSQKAGLKVPNSSITKGKFFLVPKEFVFEGAGGQRGVLLEIYTEKNEKSVQFVPAVPYSENEDCYYLDDTVLRAGEIIDRPNSSEQFTIEAQDELIGVYYINKGYPDFRQVEILQQNEEYAIVKPNSLYGLQEYDYIVLFAGSIHMNSYYN